MVNFQRKGHDLLVVPRDRERQEVFPGELTVWNLKCKSMVSRQERKEWRREEQDQVMEQSPAAVGCT